jgi:hypothetical protein
MFGDIMFLPLPIETGRVVERASLGLGPGEVRSLLHLQIIGPVAAVIAVAAFTGIVSFHHYSFHH